MPTKPTDLVKPWGTAGNYPVGFYPALYPWLTPNPNGGNPYPWNSQPRIDAGDITAFAANGLTPQQPNPAEPFNRWLNTVYQNARWVELGTSADDADAHVMETDSSGVARALRYEATAAFQGAGATKAPLPQGAVIDSGMELELQGSAGVTGTNQSPGIFGRVEFLSGGPPATSNGIAVSAAGELFQGSSVRLCVSPGGYLYATGDQESDTGNAATHQVAVTTNAVTGRSNGLVRVTVVGRVQLTALPNNFTLRLQEDQTASPAWTTIGAADVQTGHKDTSDANDWQPFELERIFSAGTTTFTKYRLEVQAGGALCRVKEVRIRAFTER